MAKVVRETYKNGEIEDADSLLKRFKKQVIREDIIYEVKRREFFMSNAEKQREKAKEARRRQRRKY